METILTMARRTIMVVNSSISQDSFASVIGNPDEYDQPNSSGSQPTLWLPAHSDRECTR